MDSRGSAAALGDRKPAAKDPGGATSAATARVEGGDWTQGDEESLQVLKLAGAIGIFFLVVYAVYDLHAPEGRSAPAAAGHWLLIAGACLFFGLTWTRGFRLRWKFWTFIFCAWLMAMFVAISSATGEGESRFITAMLCPLATASFVAWGPRWQIAMAAASMLTYGGAELMVPIESQLEAYRWFGLLAAIALSQCTAIFIGRYRDRIRTQVGLLGEAASFRESQIATMVHDIRNPLSAISGLVSLLEEDDLERDERAAVVARVGSTAWKMDLAVTNMLDLYQFQENRFARRPPSGDPTQALREIAEDCATEAKREGINLHADIAPLPAEGFDSSHLGRVARNLVAWALRRTKEGDILFKSGVHDGRVIIEVSDSGPDPGEAELGHLFDRPADNGLRKGGGSLSLYIVRMVTEADGGRVRAERGSSGGLRLVAEVPPLRPGARGN